MHSSRKIEVGGVPRHVSDIRPVDERSNDGSTSDEEEMQPEETRSEEPSENRCPRRDQESSENRYPQRERRPPDFFVPHNAV